MKIYAEICKTMSLARVPFGGNTVCLNLRPS